jgi:ubiquinone/menaquinone biosynthesis C-methylase UbiE
MARGFGHDAHGTEVVPDLCGVLVTQACAHELPFEDDSFDHVTCFDVLEHLVYDDLIPALRQMQRVARQTVTVSASEVPSIHGGRDLHISAMPAAQWHALLKEAWGVEPDRHGTAGRSPCWRLVL